MSAHRGRPEVADRLPKGRFDPEQPKIYFAVAGGRVHCVQDYPFHEPNHETTRLAQHHVPWRGRAALWSSRGTIEQPSSYRRADGYTRR